MQEYQYELLKCRKSVLQNVMLALGPSGSRSCPPILASHRAKLGTCLMMLSRRLRVDGRSCTFEI